MTEEIEACTEELKLTLIHYVQLGFDFLDTRLKVKVHLLKLYPNDNSFNLNKQRIRASILERFPEIMQALLRKNFLRKRIDDDALKTSS